jgi:hypothetical protein
LGRISIYSGGVFAVIGLIAGVYALSLGPLPNLPTPVLILLCPAAILGALAPTAEADVEFMWLIAILNAALYGALGIFLGRLFHVDEE